MTFKVIKNSINNKFKTVGKTLLQASIVSLPFILSFNTASAQWALKYNWGPEIISDIWCTDANTCYTVFRTGEIKKTTDGGESWYDLQPGGAEELRSVTFINSITGFIGGDISIFKTTDGGASWNRKLETPGWSYFNQIQFINQNVGYATGQSTIYKTTDGGETWVQIIDFLSVSFTSFYFTDTITGYGTGWEVIAGDTTGVIYKTTNGGLNWTQLYTDSTIFIDDIYFIDANTGVAVGTKGTILRTTDAGIYWDILENPYKDSVTIAYTTISFPSSSIGYIGASNGGVVKTFDGGNTWAYNSLIESEQFFQSLFFVDENIGYAAHEWHIYKTINGGNAIFDKISNKELGNFYPNPFSTHAIFELDLPDYNNMQVEIFDVVCQKIRVLEVSSDKTVLERKDMFSGLYFYNIIKDNKVIASGKLVLN